MVEQALGKKLALQKRQLTCLEEFFEAFPTVERLMLDGTERPVRRAQDYEQQKTDYSGKKKQHTRSHLGAVAPDRRILVLSQSYPGKAYDKGILNTEGWAEWIPDEVKIQDDSGLQGLQNEYVNVEIPHKKPKEGELTAEQKAENCTLAQERVIVEHAFGGLKHYEISAQVYRNRKENFDDRSMLTAAGL